MKSKFVTFFCALSIFFSSHFISQSSHAFVGLAIKSNVAKTIGGISAGGGVLLGGYGLLVSKKVIVSANALGVALASISMGVFLGGIGLLILDDKTIVDFEFRPILKSGYTHTALDIYHQELDQLNAVYKSIQAQMTEDQDEEVATSLWQKYSSQLSLETVEIAQHEAVKFIQSF